LSAAGYNLGIDTTANDQYKGITMSTNIPSCDVTAHKVHICSLKAAGNTAEIERISSNPTVECGVCGAKANCVDNVCTPAKVFDSEQVV
jgi:hypothetical protein